MRPLLDSMLVCVHFMFASCLLFQLGLSLYVREHLRWGDYCLAQKHIFNKNQASQCILCTCEQITALRIRVIGWHRSPVWVEFKGIYTLPTVKVCNGLTLHPLWRAYSPPKCYLWHSYSFGSREKNIKTHILPCYAADVFSANLWEIPLIKFSTCWDRWGCSDPDVLQISFATSQMQVSIFTIPWLPNRSWRGENIIFTHYPLLCYSQCLGILRVCVGKFWFVSHMCVCASTCLCMSV